MTTKESEPIHEQLLNARQVAIKFDSPRLQTVPLIIWRRASLLQSHVHSMLFLKEK